VWDGWQQLSNVMANYGGGAIATETEQVKSKEGVAEGVCREGERKREPVTPRKRRYLINFDLQLPFPFCFLSLLFNLMIF